MPRYVPIRIAAALVSVAVAAAAIPAGILQTSVVGGGGAPGSSASFRLNGTLGQSTPPGTGSCADYVLYAGFWRNLSVATSIDDGLLPESFRNALHPNAPNPFNPITTIRYEVGETMPVGIDIYSIQGRLVRSLVNETRSPGRYELVWDGTDDRGMSVGSGVYLSRLRIGSFTSVRKMILAR